MESWQTIWELSNQHNEFRGAVVKAVGVWSTIFSHTSKQVVSDRLTAFNSILQEYELQQMKEQQLDRRIIALNTGGLEEALKTCDMEIQNYADMAQELGIQKIDEVEILIDDGNTKIMLMEDQNSYYCIFLETA